MTVNEVNQAYEKISYMSDNIPMIIIVMFLFTIFITILIDLTLIYAIPKVYWKLKLSIFFKVIGVVFLLGASYSLVTSHFNNVENWKEKTKEEYIEKLPFEKKEIVDYVIVESNTDTKDMEYFTQNIKYTNTVEIEYLKDGVKTKKTIEVIIRKSKSLKKPYIEYKNVEKNILKTEDSIFKKGFYNTTLYIPE
jgi:hypothetical protein